MGEGSRVVYLFRAPQPRCQEPSCHHHGTYVVRSELMHPGDSIDMAPRCLRHAKMLAAWYEERELPVPTHGGGGEGER
jgi:hypothetical protein